MASGVFFVIMLEAIVDPSMCLPSRSHPAANPSWVGIFILEPISRHRKGDLRKICHTVPDFADSWTLITKCIASMGASVYLNDVRLTQPAREALLDHQCLPETARPRRLGRFTLPPSWPSALAPRWPARAAAPAPGSRYWPTKCAPSPPWRPWVNSADLGDRGHGSS